MKALSLREVRETKARILEEVQELRKEKEKLEAEQALIEMAVRVKIEELREARKTSEVEEDEHETSPLLLRLPKLRPVKKN